MEILAAGIPAALVVEILDVTKLGCLTGKGGSAEDYVE